MVTVACSLKRKGFDVSFACYHTNNFYEHILKENNIPVIWYNLPNHIKRLFFFRKLIRNGKFDAVISFLSADNFLNDFAALGGHKWKVITGERSSKESMLTSTRGRVFAWFQRSSDYIVCNSENARQMWIKHYPQYQKKLRVIYNNVHLQEITSNYIRRKDGRLKLVIAGAYSYVKDPFSLIKGLSLLTEEQLSKLAVDWYGKKGSNEEAENVLKECERLIFENHLENNIRLFDATQDITNKMYEADVVSLFSKWEGLPNAVCEGMALGKPIIMTKISDYQKLVDSSNGFLCDPQSPESIKNALVSLISLSDDDLVSLGNNSLAKARILFSDEYVINSWISLFEDVRFISCW